MYLFNNNVSKKSVTLFVYQLYKTSSSLVNLKKVPFKSVVIYYNLLDEMHQAVELSLITP